MLYKCSAFQLWLHKVCHYRFPCILPYLRNCPPRYHNVTWKPYQPQLGWIHSLKNTGGFKKIMIFKQDPCMIYLPMFGFLGWWTIWFAVRCSLPAFGFNPAVSVVHASFQMPQCIDGTPVKKPERDWDSVFFLSSQIVLFHPVFFCVYVIWVFPKIWENPQFIPFL